MENKISLFQGTGKTVCVIEIKSEKDIDKKQIIELLKLIKKE